MQDPKRRRERSEVDVPDGRSPSAKLEEAVRLCRARGGRLTPQRRVLLMKLLEAGRPVTAYELLDLVRPDDPAITPASIYRSLDFLLDASLVHRLDSTRSFIACDHPDHAHAGQFLICHECGTVVEAEDNRIIRATVELGDRYGFTLDRQTVELTGLCGACRDDDTVPKPDPAAR